MSVVKDFSLTNDHAELIVLLASLFHDLGMSINREGHEEFSLFLTNQLLPEIIDFLPIQERVIIGSETLHAIISHRSGGEPITIEAGIVRVADALDMSHGRSRIPFEAGQVNIHSLSAYAVEHIEIAEGKDRPILITILMNNSAGIFQVDELLKSKLKGSGIEKYIEVQVKIEGENESRLLKD
jgi:metal-dependent HD superfamily phosphatase/phosphodiesterase